MTSLQATALVHEAYIRLVGVDEAQHLTAAAMRRILVDSACRKKAEKRGGGWHRHDLDEALLVGGEPRHDLLELDDLE